MNMISDGFITYKANVNTKTSGIEITSCRTNQSRMKYAKGVKTKKPAVKNSCIPIPVIVRLEGPTNSVPGSMKARYEK